MRPEILNPLFTEVEALKGVGPQVAKLLKKLGIHRLTELLYHLPSGSIERIKAPAASATLLGRNVILELTPFDSRENRSGRGPTRIFASDSDGNAISLVYFNNPGWAKRTLPMGHKRAPRRAVRGTCATSRQLWWRWSSSSAGGCSWRWRKV